MNPSNPIGTWRLASLYGKSANEQVTYPYGENPAGMIIYTAEGTMSATLMQSGRVNFASGDAYNATPEELKAAFQSFDAYCGTYELFPEDGKVIHHVEASRLPNWTGSEQVRFYELQGDKLTIRSAPMFAHSLRRVGRVT